MMKVKEESKKAALKLNIQKMSIMASSPITSWQRDGEKMETVPDFIFLGSKITVDCDCRQEIKNHSFDYMDLLFNMLSRFGIAFLPKSKHLLIS